MLNDKMQTLLFELETLNTIQRVFTYGPIKTIGLAISRVFNKEVYQVFESFLSKLDDTVIYINTNSEYKVNINRKDIGEVLNKSNISDNGNASEFFGNVMTSINTIILGVIKTNIDEMYENNFSIKTISSIQSFINSKYSSDINKQTKTLLKDYLKLLEEKPHSAISLFSYLKRYYIDTAFINKYINQLEQDMIQYIRTKQSVNSDRTLNINQFGIGGSSNNDF